VEDIDGAAGVGIFLFFDVWSKASILIFVLAELARGNAGKRRGSSKHEKKHN